MPDMKAALLSEGGLDHPNKADTSPDDPSLQQRIGSKLNIKA
jgi:hypothetical protein